MPCVPDRADQANRLLHGRKRVGHCGKEVCDLLGGEPGSRRTPVDGVSKPERPPIELDPVRVQQHLLPDELPDGGVLELTAKQGVRAPVEDDAPQVEYDVQTLALVE